MKIRTLVLTTVAAALGIRALQAQSTTAPGGQLTEQTSAQNSSQEAASPIRPIQVDSTTMEAMNISKVAPVYPLEAKNAAIEGDVVLYAIVDQKGKIKSLDVLSGLEVFRVPTLAAVNQWTYAPFIVDEAAVTVGTIITVHFRLNN